MDKFNKDFLQQYKEVKIASLILSIGSLIMIISAVASEWLYIASPLILATGISIFLYNIVYFCLYWKCANYQKNNQLIPKWFRVVATIFLIFYLSFYQLNQNVKKYRIYLLLKEMRFYILLWIFCSSLTSLLEFQLIQKNNFLWLGISLGLVTVILMIAWILAIFIWKYQGNNSKLLKVLTIITLNYRNYKLYKEIIKLNTKEKTSNN